MWDGGHTHAQVLLGAHQEEDDIGWVILLQCISQPLPAGAIVTGWWPSAALSLAHHSVARSPAPSCPAVTPPTTPHAQPQSHLVPLPPCHLPRVLQGRHVVDIEDDDDGWGGERRGEMGTGAAGGGARGGDLTLCSPVVGGGDALEALLAGRVPPGGAGGEGGAVGCTGRGLAPTHSCRLKGTPSTSNRSISKSTPMVAL